MRQIAVIGLSAFGAGLVRALHQERCRILAVDLDENKVNAIREWADEAVIADARDPRALEALSLNDYDAVVISLGEPLDTSLLAVLHLRDLQVRHIVARAVSEDHRRLLQHLGVSEVVFPEADMAQRTAHTLANPNFLDTLNLGESISLIEVAPSEDIVGRTLADLNLRQRYRVTVVAVRDTLRDEIRANPDPHLPITPSDALIVLGKNEDIDRFVRRR
ncbi:MAG: TrkA family potassium uptake protein [Thermodesulfobacteriota bacterium]|jgi:trk system potassium uptake protein TrkA